MRALNHMERRLQDLERKFENKERMGKIVDVKFENQRWYVKINDGANSEPSGQSEGGGGQGGGGGEGGGEGSEDTFKSDWLPWQSFSHGSIKMSVPPKKGQHALMRSPGGSPEMAVAEPYHYGPSNPSPHDKPDEMVKLIEDEDDDDKQQGQQGGQGGGQSGQNGQQEDKYNTWVHETKDKHHLIIRKKDDQQQGGGQQQSTPSSGTGGSSGDQQQQQQKSRKLPQVEEDGDDKTVQVKTTKDGHLITVGKKKAKIKVTDKDIEIKFGEKASWKMSDKKLQIEIDGVKWTLDNKGWKQEEGKVKHDDKNIGKDHKHKDSMPGAGETGTPAPDV